MATDPSEICSITVAGTTYSQWQEVEFERAIGATVAHLRVVAMELTPPSAPSIYSNLQLLPGGFPVTVALGGTVAMTDGRVNIRQVALDQEMHSVEIVAYSKTIDLANGTVALAQYLNQPFQAIGNAVCKQFNLKLKMQGDDIASAAIPFERVSTHLGETGLTCLSRLARLRDLHLTVDVDGATLVAGRANASASEVATLVEGGNILKALVSINTSEAASSYVSSGQNFGKDGRHGDAAAESSSTIRSTGADWSQPRMSPGEMPGSPTEMSLQNDHVAATALGQIVTATITVLGWFTPGGSLWCSCLWQPVKISAPSLFPTGVPATFGGNASGGVTLFVRGVKHIQSDSRGTITILDLCLRGALSANYAAAPYSADGFPDVPGINVPDSIPDPQN